MGLFTELLSYGMLNVDQAIAFLPQFVVPDRGDVLCQLALLGVAFIVQAAFLFNFLRP